MSRGGVQVEKECEMRRENRRSVSREERVEKECE